MYNAGGLAGVCFDSQIYQCSATGNMLCKTEYNGYEGYLIGGASYCTIEECFTKDNIIDGTRDNAMIGGISNSTLINNYSLSQDFMSSITGESSNAIFKNSYSAATKKSSNKELYSIRGEQYKGSDAPDLTDITSLLELGWDFKITNSTPIWNIGNGRNDGFPYLNWEYPKDAGSDIEISPFITNNSVKTLTETSIIAEIEIDFVGNPLISEFGVCYNKSGNPSLEDNFITSTDDIAKGDFNIILEELEANQVYYITPFASNENVTTYGEAKYIYTLVETKPETPNGNGSESEPYQIETLAHLRWLSENKSFWSNHFIQTADINATETKYWNNGQGFSPIENSSREFTGNYNGNYHKITNLTINRPSESTIAMFANVSIGSIKRLILEDISVNALHGCAGLVAFASWAEIYQVSVTGNVISVQDDDMTGGIVLLAYQSNVEECLANVSIDHPMSGGIVGLAFESSLINNYSFSDVAGGIAFENFNINIFDPSTFANNYFAGTSQLLKGGIIAQGFLPMIESGNLWDEELSAQSDNIGFAKPKNTSEMKNIITYIKSGWEFNIINSNNDEVWNIGNGRNNGYPYLSWQYPEDPAYSEDLETIMDVVDVEMISPNDLKVTTKVLYKGNPIATEFGICYGESEFPTVSDNVIVCEESIEEGEFVFNISNLDKNKRYYLHTYSYNDGVITYDNLTPIAYIEAQTPSGDGSELSPYLISNFQELYWITINPDSWDKNFIQTADIDASSSSVLNDRRGFKPIGKDNYNMFKGTYNGDGHKIKNLMMKYPSNTFVRLFGYVSNAKIENLVIENCHIEGYIYVGAVAALSYNSTFSKIAVTGIIKGYESMGGIIGYSNGNMFIYQSFSDAKIFATNDNANGGGIIGDVSSITIEDCYSRSIIESEDTSDIGGLVGNGSSNSIITNNYFAGTFNSESSNKCGIIGNAYSAPSSDVGNFWDEEISEVSDNIVSAQAKSTTEMKDINTFLEAGWDFGDDETEGIWSIDATINDGYPYLTWTKGFIEDLQTIIETELEVDRSNIHPNPFTDVVNITGKSISRVKIYTISGIQMLDAKYNNETDITIQTSEFEKGIYLFIIENGEYVEIHKLIKR